MSPLGSIYGSRNQELEVGVASLAVSLHLGSLCFPSLQLCFEGKVLAPR